MKGNNIGVIVAILIGLWLLSQKSKAQLEREALKSKTQLERETLGEEEYNRRLIEGEISAGF